MYTAGKTSKTLGKPQETPENLSSFSPRMYVYAKNCLTIPGAPAPIGHSGRGRCGLRDSPALPAHDAFPVLPVPHGRRSYACSGSYCKKSWGDGVRAGAVPKTEKSKNATTSTCRCIPNSVATWASSRGRQRLYFLTQRSA